MTSQSERDLEKFEWVHVDITVDVRDGEDGHGGAMEHGFYFSGAFSCSLTEGMKR